MAIFEVTVSQHNVRREGGLVKGTLQIEVKNPDFQHNQDFEYPTDGQIRLLDQDIAIGHVEVVIAESPHGQSCVTGYVEATIAGVKTRKDFDKNCVPIRENLIVLGQASFCPSLIPLMMSLHTVVAFSAKGRQDLGTGKRLLGCLATSFTPAEGSALPFLVGLTLSPAPSNSRCRRPRRCWC